MADLSQNPFALLSLIAAPAVLTNAASVLVMSTTNRFLRASERMRALAVRVEEKKLTPGLRALVRRQVDRTERQAVLLLGALRAAYTAIGSFASASLISILGRGPGVDDAARRLPRDGGPRAGRRCAGRGGAGGGVRAAAGRDPPVDAEHVGGGGADPHARSIVAADLTARRGAPLAPPAPRRASGAQRPGTVGRPGMTLSSEPRRKI